MAMHDSITFFCPYCNEKLKEQSKAGECKLANYHQSSVPAEIAQDLKDTTTKCPVCEIIFLIACEVPRVSLRLIDTKKENGYD